MFLNNIISQSGKQQYFVELKYKSLFPPFLVSVTKVVTATSRKEAEKEAVKAFKRDLKEARIEVV